MALFGLPPADSARRGRFPSGSPAQPQVRASGYPRWMEHSEGGRDAHWRLEWSDLVVSQCARGVCSMAYCGKHRVCQEEIKKEGGADDRHQVTDAKCEAECGPSGPVSN